MEARIGRVNGPDIELNGGWRIEEKQRGKETNVNMFTTCYGGTTFDSFLKGPLKGIGSCLAPNSFHNQEVSGPRSQE